MLRPPQKRSHPWRSRGGPRRFWIGEQPKTAPPWVQHRIWLRRRKPTTHALAFESSVLRHLDVLTNERSTAVQGDGTADYRTGAPREEAPLVPLLDVMARVALENDPGDGDVWANVHALFDAAAADGEGDAAAALAAAIAKDTPAALGIDRAGGERRDRSGRGVTPACPAVRAAIRTSRG